MLGIFLESVDWNVEEEKSPIPSRMGKLHNAIVVLLAQMFVVPPGTDS